MNFIWECIAWFVSGLIIAGLGTLLTQSGVFIASGNWPPLTLAKALIWAGYEPHTPLVGLNKIIAWMPLSGAFLGAGAAMFLITLVVARQFRQF